MDADTDQPDDLHDDDVPVLEDVVVPGVTPPAAPDTAPAPAEHLPEETAEEPELNGAAAEPPPVDVQTLAATVEQIAADMRGELERKFRGVVSLAVEEALARSLRQYEEHVRLSILSHLLERMPEILAAARRDDENGK